MPTLRPQFLRAGDVVRANGVNDFLGDLSDASQSIQGDNIRRDAISSRHLVIGSASTVYSGYMSYSGGSTFTVNSTTYTLINAGTAMRLTGINTSLRQGDVIRVYASILTDVPTAPSESQDDYSFLIIVTDTTGLTSFSIGPAFTYSMLAHSDTFAVTTPSSITWNRHVVNWEYTIEDTTFNLGSVGVRAAVQNASNSIPVSIYNLAVIVDKA